MFRILAVLFGVFTLASVSGAQGFDLSPGERVTSIDGVPVQSQVDCSSGKCFPRLAATVANIRNEKIVNSQDFDLAPGERLVAIEGVTVQSQVNPSYFPRLATTVANVRKNREVARDERAYQHALREAQILAERRSVGHPLGVAPGCRYSGTGTSRSPDKPNHCYVNELPESRLVARAVVFRNGVYYWSAHYR